MYILNVLQLFSGESSFNMFWNFAFKKSSPVFRKQACISFLQSTETLRPFLGKTMEGILNLLHHLFYLFHHSHICISLVVTLLRVVISYFPQSRSAKLQQRFRPKKMQNSLSLFIFERRNAEISLDRILF